MPQVRVLVMQLLAVAAVASVLSPHLCGGSVLEDVPAYLQRVNTTALTLSHEHCKYHLHVWIDPLCPDGKRVWHEAQTMDVPENIDISFHLFALPFHPLSYEVLQVVHQLPADPNHSAITSFIGRVFESMHKFSAEALNHGTLRDLQVDLHELAALPSSSSSSSQLSQEATGSPSAQQLARLHVKLAAALGIYESPQFRVNRCDQEMGDVDARLVAAGLSISIFSVRQAVSHILDQTSMSS
ncbi:hypothetical protein PTSG_09874 [Salpingoeca rosetta]|uniref:Thioredoxin-like fold domain-containing protein n=1 Tax=Salpingoeca rosetta (strain ATCC 50818 / BSB-021) TaxID=946362 RepID=F2UND7_SALR5|nr:uncharacterized protein PTSG_09874 [Salpingoeca rosetta]EGD79142.1 hypothetical protein PTSG_09874 [Salpingoeca rosetta]|eukprot:XP_004989227.1 hypothetical protein PTSG_09874 [Salpingoeca rosetta]